jgi:paraquat-inducible protein B
MITDQAREAFNARLTVNVNSIKTMRPSELDQVKAHGSQAEALLKNRDLALFIHQFKFEIADTLAAISGHTADDNARRVALTNQLSGIEEFIKSLQRAVYMKNRVVTQQSEPTVTHEEDINVRTTYHA